MNPGAIKINTPESDQSWPDDDQVSDAQNQHSLGNNDAVEELQSDFDDETYSGAVDRQHPDRSLLLAKTAAITAAEQGGTDIVVLDMTRRSAMFDYFVIATGTSRRQIHAMSEEIDHALEDTLNDKRLNIDGYDESRWIVLDYGTVVIHLFDDDTRAFYSLEALWSDANKLDLSRELAEADSRKSNPKSSLDTGSMNLES